MNIKIDQAQLLEEMVVEMHRRLQLGLQKYGKDHYTKTAPEAIQDIKEELLDAWVYLWCLEQAVSPSEAEVLRKIEKLYEEYGPQTPSPILNRQGLFGWVEGLVLELLDLRRREQVRISLAAREASRRKWDAILRGSALAREEKSDAEENG